MNDGHAAMTATMLRVRPHRSPIPPLSRRRLLFRPWAAHWSPYGRSPQRWRHSAVAFRAHRTRGNRRVPADTLRGAAQSAYSHTPRVACQHRTATDGGHTMNGPPCRLHSGQACASNVRPTRDRRYAPARGLGGITVARAPTAGRRCRGALHPLDPSTGRIWTSRERDRRRAHCGAEGADAAAGERPAGSLRVRSRAKAGEPNFRELEPAGRVVGPTGPTSGRLVRASLTSCPYSLLDRSRQRLPGPQCRSASPRPMTRRGCRARRAPRRAGWGDHGRRGYHRTARGQRRADASMDCRTPSTVPAK